MLVALQLGAKKEECDKARLSRIRVPKTRLKVSSQQHVPSIFLLRLAVSTC